MKKKDKNIPKKLITPQDFAAQAIEILSESEQSKLHFSTLIDLFKKKIDQWDSSTWRVGLIGITSSGKSTLVNGLLGEKLLPANVKPSTNCLVMIRRGATKKVVKYYEDGAVREVTTNLSHELDNLGNELKNPSNNKKVLHLSVYSPLFKLNDDITLCDTPGLEAYNLKHHDEITLHNILPSLDLVLYISNVRLAAQENNRIVNLVSETKKPFIWVLNYIDAIKEKTEKDGIVSKSREQVLYEHQKKVRDNLYNSGITNPSSVPIAFVSSIQALREEEYVHSGFDSLINVLHESINKLKPKFFSGRLNQIAKEIAKIIESESKHEFNKEADYEKERNDIIQSIEEVDEIRAQFADEFDEICNYFNYTKGDLISSLNRINRSSIQEASTLAKEVNNCIAETNRDLVELIKDMNETFKTIRKQYNLLNEDFFHQLNSNAPHVKLPTVKTEIHEREYRKEKKPIFGLGIRKGLGELFGTDWGYDVYKTTTVEIENIVDFKIQVRNGLNSEMQWLISSKEQSIMALNNYYLIIKSALDSRILSIDDALKHTIPKRIHNRIIKQLKEIELSIKKAIVNEPKSSINLDSGKITEENILSTAEEYIEIDHLELSLIRLLNNTANYFYKAYFKTLIKHNTDDAKTNIVICHWNTSLFSEFWLRFLPDEPIPQGVFTTIETDKYKVTMFNDSSTDQKVHKDLLRKINWEKSNLILLIPVSQIGYFQKQLSQSLAAEYFRKADRLICVIADFSDFADNDNLIEYLIEFKELLISTELNPEHIALNHDDIGIGGIIEYLINDKHQLKNERDEIAFIDKMDKKGCFLNIDVKNKVSRMLPEWRNFANDKNIGHKRLNKN